LYLGKWRALQIAAVTVVVDVKAELSTTLNFHL
jgi:hypothetical protein